MRTAPALLQNSLPQPRRCDCTELKVSQRCVLPQHSCKALCPVWSDAIAAEIEVIQRCPLRKNSCKPLCPDIADLISIGDRN